MLSIYSHTVPHDATDPGRIPAEDRNPINRFLIWGLPTVAKLALRLRYLMVMIALLAIASIAPIYLSLGSELCARSGRKAFFSCLRRCRALDSDNEGDDSEARSDSDDVPVSRERLRQSWSGGERDRPCAAEMSKH